MRTWNPCRYEHSHHCQSHIHLLWAETANNILHSMWLGNPSRWEGGHTCWLCWVLYRDSDYIILLTLTSRTSFENYSGSLWWGGNRARCGCITVFSKRRRAIFYSIQYLHIVSLTCRTTIDSKWFIEYDLNDWVSGVLNVYHPLTDEVFSGITERPLRSVERPTDFYESPSTCYGAGSSIFIQSIAVAAATWVWSLTINADISTSMPISWALINI